MPVLLLISMGVVHLGYSLDYMGCQKKNKKKTVALWEEVEPELTSSETQPSVTLWWSIIWAGNQTDQSYTSLQ